MYYQIGESICKVMQDGEIVIMGAEIKQDLLNKTGSKNAHFNELFSSESDMSGGSYILDLNEGILRTRDDEGNKFIIYNNGVSYA